MFYFSFSLQNNNASFLYISLADGKLNNLDFLYFASAPTVHSGIIFQLGYISGDIGNPFSPLFYPNLRNTLPTFI